MSYQEVANKFMQCADNAHWRETKARAIIDFVKDLDAPDMRKLTALYSK